MDYIVIYKSVLNAVLVFLSIGLPFYAIVWWISRPSKAEKMKLDYDNSIAVLHSQWIGPKGDK